MTRTNIHQAFLGFFLGLAVLALGEQTYVFLKVVSMVRFNLSYIVTYIYLWLYGFDLGFFIHVDGAYQALLVIAVCIIGLKLCGSSPKVYPVVSAGEL